MVAEAVRTPYVLVTLEAKSKEKSSRTDLSRKTDAGKLLCVNVGCVTIVLKEQRG